jgi:hypothetical protein
MTNDEHLKRLDLTANEIAKLTAEAYRELLRRIDAGESPRDAIEAIQAKWEAGYVSVLSTAFSATLATAIGAKSMLGYQVGKYSLSRVLYENHTTVVAATFRVVSDHLKGWHDARALALNIYEGYGFKTDPLKVQVPLPKYMRAAFGDDKALADLMAHHYTGRELRALLDDFAIGPQLAKAYARGRATRLKTPALKAAYLQAIDAIKKGAGMDKLRKVLNVAFYERNRYFANRIAQTELHRAHSNSVALEIMADHDVDVVQVIMRSAHPKYDVCDMHARIDKYGIGPGMYPKAKAPKPSFHPFCRCVVRPILTKTAAGALETQNAERAWLRALDPAKGAAVMGSKDRLREVLYEGKPWDQVRYKKAPKGYGFETLADAKPIRFVKA